MRIEWTQREIILATLFLAAALAVACASESNQDPYFSTKDFSRQSPKAPTSIPATSQPLLESNYGGLSLGPNDNSIVNVYMVNPSQEEAEALAKRHLQPSTWQGIREVRTAKVKYSKSQLDSWFKVISDDLGVRDFPEWTSMGVSIGENRVDVGVACGAALEGVERTTRGRMAPHGIPQDAVNFEVSGRGMLSSKPASPYIYECLPPEVRDRATGLSSPGFGGMYIDYDTATINVYLLEPSQERAEELALTFFGGKIVEETGEVQALQGQYTWEQLQEWWRTILKGPWWGDQGAFPCWVDPEQNRIAIQVKRSVDENVVEKTEQRLSKMGVPKEAVIFLDGGSWPLRPLH